MKARAFAQLQIRPPRVAVSSAAVRPKRSNTVTQRVAVPDKRPAARQIAQLMALANPATAVFGPMVNAARNQTGLPDALKTGIEHLSGRSLDHVRVHRNSSRPAQLHAQAYAQGSDIHLAPGQEKHLAHEAWHVVQQAQGRVKPTLQAKGIGINNDASLEKEADVMGAKALQRNSSTSRPATALHPSPRSSQLSAPIQRFLDPEKVRSDPPAVVAYIKTHAGRLIRDYCTLKDSPPARLAKVDPLFAEIWKRQDLIRQIKADGGAAPADGAAAAPAAAAPTDAAPDGAGTIDPADLDALLRHLNVLEQETFTIATAREGAGRNFDGEGRPAPEQGIKIGTEFTFTCAALRGMKVGQNSEDKADALLDQWAAEVAKSPYKPTASAARAKSTRGKARTFTYDLGRGATWNWTMDVDDGCLETQTQPSTLGELNERLVARIVSEDIFTCAARCGLVPDISDQGGGGHISLDAQTAFGGSTELFLETLLELQNNYRAWQAVFQETDTLNAPWLAEMRMHGGEPLDAFNGLVMGLLHRVQLGEMDLHRAVRALQRFNLTLVNEKAEELRADKVKHVREAGENVTSNPDHYSAVNVEHMGEGGGAARLELRRIRAQRTPQELSAHLEYIFALIQEVRARVAARRDSRAEDGSAASPKGADAPTGPASAK